jgi:hypothetical protein
MVGNVKYFPDWEFHSMKDGTVGCAFLCFAFGASLRKRFFACAPVAVAALTKGKSVVRKSKLEKDQSTEIQVVISVVAVKWGKLDDKPRRFHVTIGYAQMAIDSRFAPGAAGFGFDITQLVNKGARLLASQNAMAELQKRSAVYGRYDKFISHENISSFTKLQGNALESFMVYLRTKAKIDPMWSDYQIMASVKLALANFTKGYSPDSTLMRR